MGWIRHWVVLFAAWCGWLTDVDQQDINEYKRRAKWGRKSW